MILTVDSNSDEATSALDSTSERLVGKNDMMKLIDDLFAGERRTGQGNEGSDSSGDRSQTQHHQVRQCYLCHQES